MMSQGKVVVVTGASSGLGAACAKAFHSVGCKLVLCGRKTETLQQVINFAKYLLLNRITAPLVENT